MISKAPPVPQQSSEDASQQPPPAAIDATAGEALVNPQNISTDEISEHEEQQTEENHEAATEENTEPEVPKVSLQVANAVSPASSSVHTVEPQQPQLVRVQKQADDRLFTWAAVGLTIAIIVLLLKKFMKASGHGAVFMDES